MRTADLDTLALAAELARPGRPSVVMARDAYAPGAVLVPADMLAELVAIARKKEA